MFFTNLVVLTDNQLTVLYIEKLLKILLPLVFKPTSTSISPQVSEMTLPNGKKKVRYAQYFDGIRVDNSVVATTETENGPEDVTGNMYKLDGKASFMSARIIGKEDAIAKAKEYYMKEHEFDESLVRKQM